MSTKINVAYRARRGVNLFRLIRDIRRKAEPIARMSLKIVPLGRHTMEPHERYNALRKAYGDQLASTTRSIHNFDVSVVIHEHRGRYYLIPYCDMAMARVLDFLKKHPDLEDFSYWNDSDHPEHVTRQAWLARGRTWDAIDKAGWHDVLRLDIVSYSSLWRVSYRPATDE